MKRTRRYRNKRLEKNKIIIIMSFLCIIVVGLILAYRFNVIPHMKYTNEKFGIEQYISTIDFDNDGIDDQTDILIGVKKYLETKPKYKSKYYESGYPDDGYGVCTDLVAQGFLEAGYDLQKLVDQDIKETPNEYKIEIRDNNIPLVLVNSSQIKKLCVS